MKGTKFAIVLAFLVSAAALAGSWFLFQRLNVEQELREELESQKVQLEDRSAFLESQVNQYQRETERLRQQVVDYMSQRDAFKKDLEGARTEASQLKQKMSQLESEKKALADRVSQMEMTEKAVVPGAAPLPVVPIASAPPAVRSIPSVPEKEKAKTAEKVQTPQKREKTAKKKEKSPPPEKKEKSPPPKAVVEQQLDQVLSVNRKFNFVVVNVGLRDRLKIGDTLSIEQKGKPIGRVQVEKLYENFAACVILDEIKNAQIQEGDLVRIS